MNEDRRPASGESADVPPSPAADAAREGQPADAGDGAPEEGAPGRAEAEAAAGRPEETGNGPGQAEAATEPPADDGGESVSGPEGAPGSAASGEPDEGVETIESLRAELDEARDEAGRERDAALRARAEVENVRRRAARDVEQAHRFGVEGLVGELLPVRDGLELGIRAAREEGSSVEALAEGTELTLRMLSAALEKFGAVEVDPVGEDFDPRFHEAMSMQEAEGVEPGKVLQVFQKGCLLHGRVVRPAMVIVSR